MRGRSSLLVTALVLIGCASPAPGGLGDSDAIDLAPREPARWEVSRPLAWASALVPDGRDHWYALRVLEIDTAPARASLDLFYLRENRQQRLEHAESPARVRLAPRVDTGSGDVVVVRARLDGYRDREIRLAARGDADRVELDLDPAPNTLDGVALNYFAGRGSVELRTRGKLVFRVQRSDRGFRVVLTETTRIRPAEQLITGSARPLVDALVLRQVGADLLMSADLSERGRAAAGELRLREWFDRARDWHVLAIDLAPEDTSSTDPELADAVLARAAQGRARGCSLAYDRALRAALDLGDPAQLIPAALETPGALAVLRDEIEQREAPPDRRAALQSVVAPELSEAVFSGALDRAVAAERACAHTDRRRAPHR
jgi:hypothetical protein